jgi:hypothetical protein
MTLDSILKLAHSISISTSNSATYKLPENIII